MYPRPERPDAANGQTRTWHPYEADPDDDVVVSELATAIRHPTRNQPPTRAELEMRLGELRSLLRAAQRGEVQDEQWVAVRRHPDLWELRWAWDDGTQVSLYFHEPRRRPGQTVAAHVHVKTIVRRDRAATTAHQNARMHLAQTRIIQGQINDWGLGWSRPLLPDQ